MKRLIWILIAIGTLTYSGKLLAQEANRFTFPANGAIFQQGSDGKHTVRLGGQVDNNPLRKGCSFTAVNNKLYLND